MCYMMSDEVLPTRRGDETALWVPREREAAEWGAGLLQVVPRRYRPRTLRAPRWQNAPTPIVHSSGRRSRRMAAELEGRQKVYGLRQGISSSGDAMGSSAGF